MSPQLVGAYGVRSWTRRRFMTSCASSASTPRSRPKEPTCSDSIIPAAIAGLVSCRFRRRSLGHPRPTAADRGETCRHAEDPAAPVEHARSLTVEQVAWPVTRRQAMWRHRREPGHRPRGGCAALVEGEFHDVRQRPPALCSYVPQVSSAAYQQLKGTPLVVPQDRRRA
jgi:hypothetical protein